MDHRRRLREVVTEVALDEMRTSGMESSIELDAEGRARAVAGAFLALVEWWLEEARALAPEQVDEVFRRTVRAGA